MANAFLRVRSFKRICQMPVLKNSIKFDLIAESSGMITFLLSISSWPWSADFGLWRCLDQAEPARGVFQ